MDTNGKQSLRTEIKGVMAALNAQNKNEKVQNNPFLVVLVSSPFSVAFQCNF